MFGLNKHKLFDICHDDKIKIDDLNLSLQHTSWIFVTVCDCLIKTIKLKKTFLQYI